MKLSDCTHEELMLLSTDFPQGIEKQASAIVEEEFTKEAEMVEVAQSCVDYGSELAMQKIAEMETTYQEKVAMESATGLDKKEEDEEDEEESEEEKNASAMGDFILEGYWNTLMEKGAEYYGDENIYLEELCKESGIDKLAKKGILETIKALKPNNKKGTKSYFDAAKGYFTAEGIQGSKSVQARAKAKTIKRLQDSGQGKKIQKLINLKKKRGANFLSADRAQAIARKRQIGAALGAAGGVGAVGMGLGRASKN